MTALLWMGGLLRRRNAQLAAVIAAIAMAVGFLGALGSFISVNRAHLTSRAASSVGVDWQVQVVGGANPAVVEAAVAKLPRLRGHADVRFAVVAGLSSTGGGGLRTTGRAFVVGIASTYRADFPREFRPLLGDTSGAVLLQQTAANLAAAPGAVVRVNGVGGRPTVRISGVVDMPQEDSFFQTVGAPPGSGASAPPDNVVVVSLTEFDRLTRGLSVVRQVHVAFDHRALPADPAAASDQVTFRRNHFETSLAGAGLVGDNLGAALSAAREDALYGQLLLLLLGLPAFLVALAVTALVVGMRKESRARELALLRMRGATRWSLGTAAGSEAALVIGAGVALGWPVTLLAADWAFGTRAVSWPWFAAAAVVVGATVAVLHLLPALRPARGDAAVLPGVRAVEVPDTRRPWALRVWLDVALLVGAGLVFWLVARGGYHVVVVPEGVPVTSVDWAALLAPAMAWPGLALLAWRLVDLVLGRIRARKSTDGGELVVAALRRRRRHAARAATALAVAVGVAGSTAVFTSTYRQQSRLDVALTVGADVSVALPAGSPDESRVGRLAGQAPHVQAVSPQVHRFAYVGADLQDIYGIDPSTIRGATPLQDAFVPGATIAGDLSRLRATPDGVLLSAETLHDYQLRPGDRIRLRLQTGTSQQYQPVPFHVIGQVTEWPTAPKDSFIIANASYLQRTTGQSGATTFLMSSNAPSSTASWLRHRLGATAHVDDISAARSSVTTASGLAATDLGGLARLELGFGVLLAVGAFGLALLVGVLERRRALVILSALGANRRQRGRFLAAEARAVLTGGLVGGAVITAAMAAMLVKVMTGIFDPPPDHAVVPWPYLVVLGGVVVTTAVLVVTLVGAWAGRAGIKQLREL
jgi:putative ABC transport system permease protein